MSQPRLRLCRDLRLPDHLRLARYRRSPEVGPRILFFSGGSALNPLCRQLVDYTHNSIHIITTFDSGGSSAALRQAFGMPAVGDIRNRLMALTGQSVGGNPEVVELFAYRFPHQADPRGLPRRLAEMVSGRHRLVAAVPDPLRKIIRNHLGYLAQALPEGFDLRGASVGNLVLAGGYLNNGRHLDPVIYLFSKLAEVRGVVRPVLNDHLHLCAELEDGRVLVGQHLLTGRVAPPLTSPIKRLFLSRTKRRPSDVAAAARGKLLSLIAQAELICLPMGSFYTSLLANLLPQGICQAIAQAQCPKVFIPNPAGDPEQLGLDLTSTVATLLKYLRQGCGPDVPKANLVDLVLLDSHMPYPGSLAGLEAVGSLGPQVLDVRLGREDAPGTYDPRVLAELLLSMV
ncbi:MAG: GAK system CofD-like protein [Desulfarculus sp.]|nr:GAK system CofD-like protein [Desulfarculus sp.]